MVAASIVAALMVGEVMLRLTGLAEPGLYKWDSSRGWGLVPGVVRMQKREGKAMVSINRDGFRGPERRLAHPRDTYRIAVLGDSFAEATQVDYQSTFCAVLERELASCAAIRGRKVEVLDFGVDSYGTAQELLTMRDQAERFSPDAVILAFFPGNDVRNNSVALEGDKCRPFYIESGGKLVPGGPFIESRPFHLHCMMRFETRRFAVLDLIGGIHGIIMTLRHSAHRVKGNVLSPRVPQEDLGLDSMVYRKPDSPEWNDAWQVTEDEIEALNDEARNLKEHFFVVSLATPMQDNLDAAIRKRFEERIGVNDLFYPGVRIKALGQRDGFPVLDLAPLMQKYAQQHHTYLHGFANTGLRTGHWNELGHRVAGNFIAQWLCERLSDSSANDKPTPETERHEGQAELH